MAPRKLAKTTPAPAENNVSTPTKRVTRSAMKPATLTPAASVKTAQPKTRVAKTLTKKIETVASGDEQTNDNASLPVAANEQPVSKARGTRKAAAVAPANSTVAISSTAEGETKNVEQQPSRPSSSRARKGRKPATAAVVEAQPETVISVNKKLATRKRRLPSEEVTTTAAQPEPEPAPKPTNSTQKRSTVATNKTPAAAVAVESKPTRAKRGTATSTATVATDSTSKKTTKEETTSKTRSTRTKASEVKATESLSEAASKSRKNLEPISEVEEKEEPTKSTRKKTRAKNQKQETAESEEAKEIETPPVVETINNEEVPEINKPRQRGSKMATGKTLPVKEQQEVTKAPTRRGRQAKNNSKAESEVVTDKKDVADENKDVNDVPDGSKLADQKTGELHPSFVVLDNKTEAKDSAIENKPTSSKIKTSQAVIEKIKVEDVDRTKNELVSKKLNNATEEDSKETLKVVDKVDSVAVVDDESESMEICEVKQKEEKTHTENARLAGQKRKLNVVKFSPGDVDPAKKPRVEIPAPLGDLFTFGEPMAGELGPRVFTHNGCKAKKTELGLVKLPSKVKQVALGAYHTVVLTEPGSVITFGVNDDFALGRLIKKAEKSNGNHSSEKMEESLNGDEDSFDNSEDEDEYEERIAGKPLPVSGIEHKVIKVTAGDMHSAALCENGDVYIWGNMKLV